MLSEYELRVLREIEADLEGPAWSGRTAARARLRWLGWAGAVVWVAVICVLGVFVGPLAAVVAAATSLVVAGATTPFVRCQTARIWRRWR